MEKLKFELHAHTADVSRCGRVPGRELVKLYKEAGYCGMMITDHINPYTFDGLALPTWQDKAEHFLKGYRAASEAAGDDFSVFLGAELHFHENNNDYLIYGLTEDLLCHGFDNTVLDWNIEKLSAFTHEAGLLLVQAHPFRQSMVVVNPVLLDGIEVMNGHPRHDSRNFIAEAWANRYGKLKTSGSDAHEAGDVGRGGIYLYERPASVDAIVEEIRKGAWLIRPEDAV